MQEEIQACQDDQARLVEDIEQQEANLEDAESAYEESQAEAESQYQEAAAETAAEAAALGSALGAQVGSDASSTGDNSGTGTANDAYNGLAASLLDALNAQGGDGLVQGMPSLDDIFRMPQDLANHFLQALNSILQNNPSLIDPNAMTVHHLLPQEFMSYFANAGLNINDDEFKMPMRAGDHLLRPDGLHTGPRDESWNGQWRDWIEQNPTPDEGEIRKQLDRINKGLASDEENILQVRPPIFP